VTQSLPQDVERFLILDVIAFDIRITAPKVGFEDSATSYPEFQTPVTQVVQHADFLDQAQGMMQWQDVDTGGEP
jgi:hypothetical protein